MKVNTCCTPDDVLSRFFSSASNCFRSSLLLLLLSSRSLSLDDDASSFLQPDCSSVLLTHVLTASERISSISSFTILSVSKEDEDGLLSQGWSWEPLAAARTDVSLGFWDLSQGAFPDSAVPISQWQGMFERDVSFASNKAAWLS